MILYIKYTYMIYKISWWNKLKVEPGLDMKMILYLAYIYDVQE